MQRRSICVSMPEDLPLSLKKPFAFPPKKTEYCPEMGTREKA